MAATSVAGGHPYHEHAFDQPRSPNLAALEVEPSNEEIAALS